MNNEDETEDLLPIVENIDGNEEDELKIEGGPHKVSLNKQDRSLHELYRWHNKGRIIVDPEWQRRYVWDTKRASKLIESFLIDLPVPVIYLSENEESNYEVIDGLQRLTSVFRFFKNEFNLQGLVLRSELNGKLFSDLPKDIQSKLEDTTLRTFELAQSTPKDLMFLIFERLNTGGIALNDMEIRNCLYRGRMNDLIKELVVNKDFQNSLSQRGIEKRMLDRSLALRFFAFYQFHYTKAKKGLKAFLNEFLTAYRNPTDEKIKDFRVQFAKASKASLTIFGKDAFRLRRDKSKGGGVWASRVNASVCQIIMTSFTEYDIGQLTRASDAINESYNDLIATDKKWVDSVTSATGDYTRIDYAFSTWYSRLKSTISSYSPNDKIRCFSKSLKEELYAQYPNCAICGNKITLLLDAALDHVDRYWEGGKTVPDNARLTHRSCNLLRPKK